MLAFVGMAILAADMATIYSNLSLDEQVEAAARARLRKSAAHFAEVAALIYAQDGRWTESARATLVHLARMDELAARVVTPDGVVVVVRPEGRVEAGASASAALELAGGASGVVTVSLVSGRLMTPEEILLTHRLNRMHLAAGLLSASVALVVALYLAFTLSRPLKDIRAGAEAIGAGDLATRVKETGDIEIRSVAHALNSLAASLQHEEVLRKENVADFAHELRTPLMGLLARIEAAQDGVLKNEAANLDAMHQEATRLARLLDDLSALADAQRPGILLSLEPVDLAEVAAAQVKTAAEDFAGKGIRLTADLHPVAVAGDAGRLEQVVANLLSNALRYTDPGGTVTVAVRRQGSDGVVEVTDTGIGIPAEDLGNVFSRFWRGERSRSRATGGAGIGLSIVQELVKAHGGRVEVESTPGVGSTFRVIVPAVASASSSRHPHASQLS